MPVWVSVVFGVFCGGALAVAQAFVLNEVLMPHEVLLWASVVQAGLEGQLGILFLMLQLFLLCKQQMSLTC